MNILEKAIEAEGSATALARSLGLVPHAISMWRLRSVPRSWEMLLKERYQTLNDAAKQKPATASD